MCDLIRRALALLCVGGLVLAAGCESGGSDDDDDSGPISVSGDWAGSYRLGGGSAVPFTMNLVQKGDAITGTYVEGGSAVPVSGSRKGDKISFFIGDATGKAADFDGMVSADGNAMDGTMVSYTAGGATGTWQAKRN